MKSNLREEVIKSLDIYQKVLEHFSSTFSNDFYFSEILKTLTENIDKRKEIIKYFEPTEIILGKELFTPEKTAEKFDFFYKKIKESEISIESGYSLLFGIENSIFEKFLPVRKLLKDDNPLYDFLKITESSIKFLKDNSKFFNLKFL